MVAEGLRNIYRVSEVDRPSQFGAVVPGEFPERLNGLDYRSRGMSLSPWTPPTYFWLAVEGLLGLRCSLTEIELNPATPSEWGWLAVKNLSVHGIDLSALLHDGVLYASALVKSRFPVQVGKDLHPRCDAPDLVVLAFEYDHEVVVFSAGPANSKSVIRFEQNGSSIAVDCTLGGSGSSFLRLRRNDLRQ